ncbi:ImmA/IrrE family metallo-endopeptidase [Thermomicrobium sp. CFH 73360]|uniref:ImmA/IrrE family metallo-endopeptidase n=1 Tax=Thermomicrobium sp. CFH 73360 TaxID=2951987 RepID=UPI002077642F|nr:ImmA/IrrE family metallo-endopeptidase [Thermomicrobium sp. CFH 73360]MCM8746827.1 ImmA/IrrE family metallo-endopeptidase [Thermomicrobium sp. CFH 73360]
MTPRLWPLNGFAITIGPVRRMEISADLSRSWRRWVIAHELAHVILGDPSVLHLCAADDSLLTHWLRERIERRANHAAAYLLIPEWVVRETRSLEQIAARCSVPNTLAAIPLLGELPSSLAHDLSQPIMQARRRHTDTVLVQDVSAEVCHV